MRQEWNSFVNGIWTKEINVRDFIQMNYKEYKGDHSFLEGATPRTEAVMKKLNSLFALSLVAALKIFLNCSM